MLQREIQALSVLNSVESEQEVALDSLAYTWSGAPITQLVDWSLILEDSNNIAKLDYG